jgi:phospholipase D1/2
MRGTAERARGRASTPSHTIFEPGSNCWRVDRAQRFYCIQDAADHFRLVRQAMLNARHTVFVLGWDISAFVDLLPTDPNAPKAPSQDGTDDAPTRLDKLVAEVVRRRPRLRVFILIWDYAALYTLERDPLSRWRLGWRTHRRVRFGFDDRHPVGGSHHQKVVVVDDRLAFSGGIDLTGHRWDTPAHRVEEPARVTPIGTVYTPYHEVHAMVDGPAAAGLGLLARERWRALGEKRLPKMGTSSHDLWPEEIAPDLTEVDVAISRTVPGSDAEPAIRECEALFFDSIARARRYIYIESQYFTNDKLAQALARRLEERDGPEMVIVTPDECHGWLEKNTMGAFRASVFRQLIAADRYKRLRLVYPAASRSQHVPTFVHSKVMVMDDELVRIGSANFSRRSMGVDTECDLTVDAVGDERVRAGIRHIRNRLLGEHLNLSPEAVDARIERMGSLRALVDARQDADDHTLVRIQIPAEEESALSEALRAAADPDEPMAFAPTVTDLVPRADATTGLRPLPIPLIPLLVLATVLGSIASASLWRPEFRALQDALADTTRMPWMLWVGAAAFVVAALVLLPLELMAILAGVLFGAVGGGMVALAGSMGAAAITYALGRALGPTKLARWMSRRSYRSVRQLGARGIVGVVTLRLASVASAGAIHLLCGAGRVPFGTFILGSLIGLTPMIAGLSGVGALLRETFLAPSVLNGAITIGATLLLAVAAVALRTVLLIRQFAPSMSYQRSRAEFG